MYGQNPQGKTHESLYGHFYVSENEWVADYDSGIRGKNLKGCTCMLDFQQTDEALKCRSIHVGPGSFFSGATAQTQYAVGILADDMIMGKDKLVDTWVRVLIAGYTDRVQMTNTAAADDNEELIVIPNDTLSGNHVTVAASAFDAAQNLRMDGYAIMDTTVNPNVMHLDGSAGAGITWIRTPGVDRSGALPTWTSSGASPTGGSLLPGQRVIGWRIPGQGDLTISPEERDGLIYDVFNPGVPPIGHKVTPGYVNFLHPFSGWI